MHETLLILETLEKLTQNGERAALATVVRTSGSTYRKEGAKMIISEKGDQEAMQKKFLFSFLVAFSDAFD